jgi:hypothetical protein
MGLEVTCDCGGGVYFHPEDTEPAPLYSSCDDCGQTYRLDVSKTVRASVDTQP